MPYTPSFSPLAEARAIFSSSLKAAATGAVLITLFVFVSLVEPEALTTSSARDFASSAWQLTIMLAFGFAIAFLAGLVATALCLFLFGIGIARLMRSTLASKEGALISIAAAVALSGLVGLIFQDLTMTYFALPFAIPAALFYRGDILTETAFD